MESEEAVEANPIQNQDQPQGISTNQFRWKVLTVYLFLISGLVISGLTFGVLSYSETFVGLIKDHFMSTMVLTSLLMTVNTNIFNRIPYTTQKGNKSVFWVINCVLATVPILRVEPPVMAKGVLYTLVLFLILSFQSFIIPKRMIESYLQPLTAIHSLVLVCTVYSVLFNTNDLLFSKIIMAGCLYGGFLVYAGLLICNTHRLFLNARHPYFDPMFSAFVFYMNVINLFSRITVFTGRAPSTLVVEKVCNY